MSNDVMARTALHDPVDGSTFMALEVAHPLLRSLSQQYWITIREVYAMVRVAIFGARGADEDWDPFLEIEQKIADGERDATRLRQLREEGGSPDEVTEIIERTRAGLEWLMRFDPSRAGEIKAFLAGSALRIRKRIVEKRGC